MRQRRVPIESSLILPGGMNVEELWIASGAKGIDLQAARFFPSENNDAANCVLNRAFLARMSTKSREDVELHGRPISTS